MATTAPAREAGSTAWLVALASECLRVPAEDLDVRTPLTRYGLDSLAAAELTAAIGSALDRALPDWLLLDHPDIESLERCLRSDGLSARVADAGALGQIHADAVLPPEIHPAPRPPADPPRAVLLTGATGFLGAYLLRALLRETDADVHCLVRGGTGERGVARVREALEHYGIWEPAFGGRVRPVDGDLARPGLGLSPEAFDALADRVDVVYHGAAAVDWVLPYAALRDVNVHGTRELLRLAVRGRPKPFHFVSSLSVCYATSGPREVTEEDDPLPYVGSLHLGYAQSKCVAEALVRQAGRRGLPVTIHRPSLISGDARSGISNADDFLSRFTRACIEMACAPDLDLALDCCPVDYVADAIVRAAGSPGGRLRVFHLVNGHTRHWRGYVLWLNLFGYPVRLVPYRTWLRRLEAESTASGHPLQPLRAFFLSAPPGAGGLTLPELYELGRRSRVRHDASDATLAALALPCPPLGAALLDRYFASFIARGLLPGVAGRGPGGPRTDGPRLDTALFTSIVRRFHGDAALHVTQVVSLGHGSDHSILSELTSWRSGRAAGLFPCRLTIESAAGAPARVLPVMVKVKAPDDEVLEVGERLARLCGRAVGRAYTRFRDRLGLRGAQAREVAVYGQTDPRFRRHVPAAYGDVRSVDRGTWTLVLELLADVELMDTADDVSGWRREHVEAALGGIAEIHAIWYRRDAELLRQTWLGPVLSAGDMTEMAPLWRALADHAGDTFAAWLGPDIRRLQRALIAGIGRWWRPLGELPRTLVHNDFNPRNVALRRTEAGLRLCAYDWELATVGVPQHDLAEFLCFVLGPHPSRDAAVHYLEVHRAALERATGRPIPRPDWALGFRLALADLLVNRLAMYALVHRFREARFLERVMRTWWGLYELFPAARPGAARCP